MTDSAVERMKNFQIFLLCSADVISLILNGGILILILLNKNARRLPSNLFFVSIIFFQFITAICAINLAVLFQENKTEELRKDTFIVQVTFTMIGLGLHHFMLTIDRIMLIKMQDKYTLVMGSKQTWLMLVLSWFIPTVTAISSSAFASNGKTSSQVPYALAILMITSGITLAMALLALNVFILKETRALKAKPFERTRRLRREITHKAEYFLPCRISMAMAVSYIVLLFPQIMFAFGKLFKIRGLLDMWYMKLSSTLMLCGGIVDASLYIYMNTNLRDDFHQRLNRIRGKKDIDENKEDVSGKQSEMTEAGKNMDTLLLKYVEMRGTDITLV